MGRIHNFLSSTRSNPSSPPPRLLKIRSSKAFIITTISVAVFSDIFLYGIIVPVVPFSLSVRAGVPQSDVQSWVSVLLSVYGGALLVSSPLSGWFADVSSSRRLPLLLGLIALGGSTVLLCLARTVALLVLGRILQGCSGAVVWTVGLALLVDTVGQKEIGQTLGWVSLSMSLGIMVAPLLGGVVYKKAGYYSVFYIAFGLIFVDIILRLALIEKKIARQWVVDEVADPSETLTSPEPASFVIENSGEEKRTDQSLPDTTTQAPEPPSEAIQLPRRSKYPPIFTLLASRRILAALWGCIVQASLLTAFDSVLPLFVKEVFHWNSVGAGLVFLAIIVPNLSAPLVGWICDRYGPRWPTVVGFMLACPFWIMLRLITGDTLKQKVFFFALLSLIGVALTLVLPPLMAEITYGVEAKEKRQPGRFGANGAYAQAYGLFIMAFAAGSLIGPIWSGYVKEKAGWATMSWTLGLFSVAGAVPCLIWTGGYIMDANPKSGTERAVPGSVDSSGAPEGGDSVA